MPRREEGLGEKLISLTGRTAPRDRVADALVRAGGGDRHAFEELYRLTSAKLFALCLRILSRRHEAEDALQDAFLTIWRRAGAFDPARGTALAWLTVVTRNVAIDRLRARRPTGSAELSEAIPDDGVSADAAMIADQEEGRLLACLESLDPVDRAFLTTAFLQGMTYADLATREQLPLGTVKSRIRRALLKMRGRLE